jgi:hypothetical protein
MTLRLVHPAPAGQHPPPTRRKGDRSPALFLTAEETKHFRAAAHNAARAYGGFACLAAAIGVPVDTLHAAMTPKRRPSAALALRLARASGMHVETMLSGALSEAGRCNACGSRIAAGGAR